MKNYTLQPSKKLFLEWVNDFLTIKKFAEYHCTSEKEMIKLLEDSRYIMNEENNIKLKQY